MDYFLMVSFSLLLKEYKAEAIRQMNSIQVRVSSDLWEYTPYLKSHYPALDSHIKILVATDPRIAQERFMFGKRNSLYGFENDDPATTLERATDLEKE
ncbi:hypothetical protein Tco_1082804 [Tanacetum coccineum]|uniref:Uncharacterized protein n=1 Tax=Tanacetum coccineum TaxID=301880 RepID=A0ABQ5I2Q3_9ASTR